MTLNPETEAKALIEAAGKQAYHRAVSMTVQSSMLGDTSGASFFAEVAKELMRQGYHRYPRIEEETDG